MKALLIHDVIDHSRPDEADTLEEAESVISALSRLGISSETMEFSTDLNESRRRILERSFDFIFNLVESVEGKGMLIHLATTIYDLMNYSYTGNTNEALFITSNKVASKQIMSQSGISTADWIEPHHVHEKKPDGCRYIIKSIWEHASIGIDDDSIFTFNSHDDALRAFAKKRVALGPLIFAEKFVSGREFNISLVADSADSMRVLSPAEMTWGGKRAGDNVMGYSAKWVEDAADYDVTRRTFDFAQEDKELLENLTKTCYRCAEVFKLRGYARVDFRVNDANEVFVLEVNANPCLSPESGIAAASQNVGISYDELIKLIVENRVIR